MSPSVISCPFLCRCCLTIRTSVGGGEHTIAILYNTQRPCRLPEPKPYGVKRGVVFRTWDVGLCDHHALRMVDANRRQEAENYGQLARPVPEPLLAYKFRQLTFLGKVSNSSGQNLLFADRFTDILSVFTFIHIVN
jgi:hypothetical protein